MRPLLAFLIAPILAFGCTGQMNGNEMIQPENQQNHINTANISFYRDGSLPSVSAPPIPAPKPKAHYNFSAVTNATGSLIVYYFHSAECSACKAFAPDMAAIENRHPEVEFRDYDLATTNGSTAYGDYVAQYNLTPAQQYIPQTLVNGTVITDMFNINATLEGIIKNFTSNG